MKEQELNISRLLSEIEELKAQLFEANSIIDAIKEGGIDALVVNKDGVSQVYSIESADYTYRILIEKFGEGALSISENDIILYCNDYFAKLSGMPANKITGTFFNSYVDSVGDYQRLKAALVNGPSKGEIVLNINGKKLPVYVSLTDLRPNVAAIGLVVTDLTEKRKHDEAMEASRRQLELKVTELNQTNTNLEQFIHVISHDLKEPLRKIITYTSHLSAAKAAMFNSNELSNLYVINSSALRLNSLVDDLVKYAFSATKADTGKVNLNSILKEVTDDLELVIKENAAQITAQILPDINASAVQMRQLFSNLISNAIKYSKNNESPKINITSAISREPGGRDFYKISLHDNGIGMDNTHLSKIFTIFQRLHMRNEYSGNGIGLAICKKIMENHQGKIDVESELNNGSTFNLYFPVKNNE